MEPETLILGLGILLGLVYTHRTGWGAGASLTPGLLALHASQPSRLAAALGIGCCWPFPWPWGCAVSASTAGSAWGRPCCWPWRSGPWWRSVSPWGPSWLGWVVPGLVAADVQRQGALPTLAGACSVGAAAALAAGLLLG
jgi:hypothetical protein